MSSGHIYTDNRSCSSSEHPQGDTMDPTRRAKGDYRVNLEGFSSSQDAGPISTGFFLFFFCVIFKNKAM